MSNYLSELEAEIILRWPNNYNKLRKSYSYNIITSLDVCIEIVHAGTSRRNSIGQKSIDLYVMEERVDFNEVIWSLTSSAPLNAKGVKHIQTYWIKPDEVRSGYETIHFNPGDCPDKEGIPILSVRQVVEDIALSF